jgi:hypothetical protein
MLGFTAQVRQALRPGRLASRSTADEAPRYQDDGFVMTRRIALLVTTIACLLAWPARGYAATTIDGGEVGGQVWTAAGSPYLVTGRNGHLSIAVGQELRIEAGTVVSFSGAIMRVKLEFRGTLTINGTAAAPVILQGEAGATSSVSWGGIQPSDGASVKVTGAIIRNAVTGLRAFGGASQADVRVDRTIFEACDVAVSVSRGTYSLDSIVVRDNGTGIEAWENDTTLTVTNVVVQRNRLQGISGYDTQALTVINSTVDGNGTGVFLRVIRTEPREVEIQNTILSNNGRAVDLNDGAATMPVASAIVTSSTFWANEANVVHFGQGATTVVASGSEATPGQSNMVADPRYASATDLRPTSSSPCIDSGAAPRAPDHDLDFTARPQGAAFDRGAFELVPGGGAAGAAGGGGAAVGGAGGRAGAGGGAGAGGVAGAGGGAGASGVAGAGGGGAGGLGGGAGTNASGGGGASGLGGSAGVSGSSGGAAGGRGGGSPVNGAKADDGCGCHLGGAGRDLGAAVLVALTMVCLASRRQGRRSHV